MNLTPVTLSSFRGITPSANRPAVSPRFSGTDPNEPVMTPTQIAEFTLMLDALRTRIADGVHQKDLQAITARALLVAQNLQNLPQGKFYLDPKTKEHVIDPLDGEKELRIPGTRKVYGPGTDVKTFLDDAFGKGPRLVICPVGWTVPDPDNVASLNPRVAARFAEIKEALSTEMDPSSEAFAKAFTKAKKTQMKAYYEAAFTQWWGPVQEQLNQLIKRNGFENGQVVFLTSASYDGIDKAAIDFASTNGMKVAMVTPFTYARWMSTEKNYPLLLTNTIKEYADACSQADVTLATGGREHTLGEDIARGLIGKKTTVLAVDILSEALKINIPAWKDGKIENAAAYMQDQGFQIANNRMALNPVNIPNLRDSQRDAVAILDALFLQKNIGRS